ncbi:MAG: NACHT domain-containing protein, partial [Caldilinea sp.]
MSQAKLIGAQLGMAVFGPTGALIGGVAGAVMDAALPWGSDVFKNTIAELLASRVERVATTWMGRNNAPQVNHDLQRAFRDAVREALADMGGPTCFPKAWPSGRRDAPPEVVFLSSSLGRTSQQQRTALKGQVCQLLNAVTRGIEQDTLLPLQPASDQPAASVTRYIESATSQALADSLYDAVILPVQRQYASLFSELPDLEPHLRRFLLARTMFHLGELLKRRTESWRAFNRWILEDVRDSLAEVRGENKEIAEGMTELNRRIDRLLSGQASEPGLGYIATQSANSMQVVRIAAEDMTLLVDVLIENMTRQQERQLAELGSLIDRQTTEIVTAVRSLLKQHEITLITTLTQPATVTPQRGQVVAAFRSQALRLHRTQSISWRGLGGRSLMLDRIYFDQELTPWDDPDGENEQSSDRLAVRGKSPVAMLLDQGAVVVLGEPGSGKTILLHKLALELATACDLTPDGAVTLGFLPIFVPLAGFTQATDDLGVDPAARLLGYVQRVADARTPGMADVLDDLMAEGRVAFLFDALDEVSGRTEQHAVLAGIQALTAGAGSRCLFAVTAREAIYGGFLVLNYPFRAYRLALMSTAAQQEAIRSWVDALIGSDERDADIVESRTRRIIGDLGRHPGMRQALRNPLLLRIAIQVQLWAGTTAAPAGIGQRFDLYVDRLLQGGGESSAREPAWPDPNQARAYLERIAWKMYGGARRRTQAEAEQLLQQDCGLTPEEARRFIRRVHENAGLFALVSYDGQAARPDQTALSFGPHALFGDFLVGSALARRWHQDRRKAAELLRCKADDPAWQQAVLFCLSLLWSDEGERKAAFGLVLDELTRAPLWGVRCLREGLELTADELATDQRRQVVQRLTKQADTVMNPTLLKGWRLRLRHRSDNEFRSALNVQYETLEALGKLQLCEVAEPVMSSVFWLSADTKHVGGTLRNALMEFGPRCLWPALQAALASDESWERNTAAWIISSWRNAEAIPALEWLLQRDEFATAAIYGLAQISDESVDATYRSLLADPRYADEALSAGLLSQRPSLLDYALSELRADRLRDHHVKFMLEYALRLSSLDAMRTVREILAQETTSFRTALMFEADRTLQLPLLRVLVSLLQEPDAGLRERAQAAILRALKAGDLDTRMQDSQSLLEQMMLYGDDWFPDVAVRQLGAVTISDGAADILWNRLQNSETRPDALGLLRLGVRLPEDYRHKVIGWLQQEIEHEPDFTRFYYGILASLGDRS